MKTGVKTRRKQVRTWAGLTKLFFSTDDSFEIRSYHRRRQEVNIVCGERVGVRVWKCALVVFVLSCFLSGCVTRIERHPYHPYATPEEESLSQELRRVFGWDSQPGLRTRQEPFYKRFAKRITRTVGGLFHEEAAARTPGEELRQRVEREQAEAIRELREQNAEE